MAGRRRRPPGWSDLRAARWANGCVEAVRQQLQTVRVDEVSLPRPPTLPRRAVLGVRAVLRGRRCTCLERALVLQSWAAAHGHPRHVVIGVTGPRDFAAHAWLDGEPQCHDCVYHEITRLPPP